MRRLAALGLAAALAVAGCGDDGADGGGDDQDKRAATEACLRDEGLPTRLRGDNELLVGDPRTGPMVRFYLTGGEAEAAQFQGNAEGSEQISSALLFVREADDDLLDQVEACVTDVM
jgi:hypothetical protein